MRGASGLVKLTLCEGEPNPQAAVRFRSELAFDQYVGCRIVWLGVRDDFRNWLVRAV
jgi:hypothetical protein